MLNIYEIEHMTLNHHAYCSRREDELTGGEIQLQWCSILEAFPILHHHLVMNSNGGINYVGHIKIGIGTV